MDRLIQMGKDLGYEGKKLQDFVKQQQDNERGERIAERELERDRIAAQENERAHKLAERAHKIAAQEKDRDIEIARIAPEEAKADKNGELERDRIAAQNKNREIELAKEEAKIAANERYKWHGSKVSRSRLREIGN